MAGAIIKILIVILCISIATGSLKAQTLKYKVVWRGDSVGLIEAYRYDSTGFLVYRIISKIEFRFLGRRTIEMDFESIYSNGSLIQAKSRYSRDSKLRNVSHINFDGSGYLITIDGKLRDKIDKYRIPYSIASIYHNEPLGVSEILSERYGEMSTVNAVKPGHYNVKKPDGRNNIYIYENGICQLVVVDNFFATFYFELLN